MVRQTKEGEVKDISPKSEGEHTNGI